MRWAEIRRFDSLVYLSVVLFLDYVFWGFYLIFIYLIPFIKIFWYQFVSVFNRHAFRFLSRCGLRVNGIIS